MSHMLTPHLHKQVHCILKAQHAWSCKYWWHHTHPQTHLMKGRRTGASDVHQYKGQCVSTKGSASVQRALHQYNGQCVSTKGNASYKGSASVQRAVHQYKGSASVQAAGRQYKGQYQDMFCFKIRSSSLQGCCRQ
jgi:hypothetical protein